MGPEPIDLPANIVERLRRRDESAYETITQMVAPSLIRYAAHRLGSVDAAHDIVQDVLYGIWQQGEKFPSTVSIVPYLFAAVRNRILDVIRHESVVRRSHTVIVNEMAVNTDSTRLAADHQLQVDEDIHRLRHAIEQLTEHQRTALSLRYEHGMTIGQIATVLGITPKGAERLMTRIRKVLRDYFLE